MDKQVEEFDQVWKSGDRERAKAIAIEYVGQNRDNLDALIQGAVRAYRQARLDAPPSLQELVALVDAFRGQGDEASRLTIDMVLLAGYEPQEIKGKLHLGGLMSRAVLEAEAILRGE